MTDAQINLERGHWLLAHSRVNGLGYLRTRHPAPKRQAERANRAFLRIMRRKFDTSGARIYHPAKNPSGDA